MVPSPRNVDSCLRRCFGRIVYHLGMLFKILVARDRLGNQMVAPKRRRIIGGAFHSLIWSLLAGEAFAVEFNTPYWVHGIVDLAATSFVCCVVCRWVGPGGTLAVALGAGSLALIVASYFLLAPHADRINALGVVAIYVVALTSASFVERFARFQSDDQTQSS
jgi:hypothetical protein